MTEFRRYIAVCLLIDLVAHALLLADIGGPMVSAAALIYAVALAPGLLLGPLLLGRDAQVQTWPERLLLGAAVGFALLPLIALLVSYWPGPLTLTLLLLPFAVIVIGASLAGWRMAAPQRALAIRGRRPAWTLWPTLALLSVLALTAYFRLANLSYAEFQGDEAKVVLHAMAAVQGDEAVLFLHRRGPADVLTPAAVATLNTPLTEGAFRLPFALSSIVVVGILFLLGQAVGSTQVNPGRNLYPDPTNDRSRGFLALYSRKSTLVAWLAGLLLASEGLFVAFARIVQYQAFIHLSAAGTLYVLFLLVRAAEEDQGEIARPLLRNYLLLAALFFTSGLLAHYEAIIVIVPAAYLLWRLLRSGLPAAQLVGALIWPAGLTIGMTAAFYLPFLLNPRFQATAARYGEKVVGDLQNFFNHLPLFIERSSFYSFYGSVWIMLGLLALYPLLVYRRAPQTATKAATKTGKQTGRRTIGLIGTLAMLTALANVALSGPLPAMGTPLLVGVFLLVAMTAPEATPGERMLWLWLGPAMFLALFLIRDPNLHFYIFVAPWALLVAIVLEEGWRALRTAIPLRPAQALAGVLLLGLLLPRLAYAQRLFVYNGVEIQRNWATQGALPDWLQGGDPAGQPIFGFPHKSGWKTVGMLYADGTLSGSYSTNIRDWVSAWYTRSAELCEEDADWVILETVERPEEQAELRAQMGDRYVKRGEIYVGERLGMELYGRNRGEVGPVVRYQAAALAADFDATLANRDLHPVVAELEPRLESVYYRFGDDLALTGYQLFRDTAQPGEALSLLLRWEALRDPAQDVALFTQVLGEDARKLGQRDTEPACNAGPTSSWALGDVAVGHYRIPLDPAAPAGEYPLIFGLYGRDDGHRLPIFDADGNPLGDALSRSQITIGAP